ncbi:MAG: acyl transferase [Chitinophagaceae bacterium]|jgi:hypothetical protein
MQFNTINGNDLVQSCVNDFEGTVLQVYRHQIAENELYKAYHDALHIDVERVNALTDIPFLPISFFKSHKVKSFRGNVESVIFDSSGTSGMIPSRHYVLDEQLYDSVSLNGFEQYYGESKDWVILALLPSYLERKTSSLVHMANMLMKKSGNPDGGFYLNEFEELSRKIKSLQSERRKILLLGVTFALLDFAEAYPMDLSGVTVMETGGMKGRKEEWTREQVHQFLKEKWNLKTVHAEYGMTELLSQAYAKENGLFKPIHTMRALVRDVQDPLETKTSGSGVLNIIDLANVHSCSFIATEDMGKVNADGTFEVLGRMDFAALRGCSLMAV